MNHLQPINKAGKARCSAQSATKNRFAIAMINFMHTTTPVNTATPLATMKK
jgi:hypothetical protein